MKMEGVSTLFIRSYLQALNRQLTLFQKLLCECVFGKYFEMPILRQDFIIILVSVLENAYKVFQTQAFSKYFQTYTKTKHFKLIKQLRARR